MKIIVSKRAVKTLKLLQPRIAKKLITAIENLPDSGDMKHIKGGRIRSLFRLHIGKYRVIFTIEGEIVKILKIDTCGDVYKNK